MSDLCLVSASGGLDSSTTLGMLKLAGYKNIIACHFDYGHRSNQAEKIAITNVCKQLDIPLKIFDVSNIYKELGSKETSILLNETKDIVTGTDDEMKTMGAWVPMRNGLFMCIMAALAETEVMKHNYDIVYLLGGMLNLSESSCYVDNSEYFLMTQLESFKYSTLIGNRIKPLFGLSDIMKFEQFEIIKEFKDYLMDAYKYTISCDRAIVDDNGIPRNCMHNGIPACGSGLLSYWASKMVGLDDTKIRNFYECGDDKYHAYVPGHMTQPEERHCDIHQIIDRIHFDEDHLQNLHDLIK